MTTIFNNNNLINALNNEQPASETLTDNILRAQNNNTPKGLTTGEHLNAVQENGTPCGSYETYTGDYPAVGGQCYYGRGPIQLSWNYNYGRFSDFLYGNNTLLNNPSEVHTNGVTSFKSATSIFILMS